MLFGGHPSEGVHDKAQDAAWQAKFTIFTKSLEMDWNLIRTTQLGCMALHDILAWHETEHTRKQGVLGKSLVSQFMQHHFPKCTASN